MIVIDASAVVDVLCGVEATDELRRELSTTSLHAPALLDYEVVSALRGLTLGGKLTATRALDALADFGDLKIRRWPDSLLLRRRAFELRDILSAYDAAYVALAEVLECPLVTRDSRLAASMGYEAQVHLR